MQESTGSKAVNKKPESRAVSETEPILLKSFATSYEPKSGKEGVIPFAPQLNSDIKMEISRFAKSGTRKHEKFVVLIFLKLYRFHLENFNQSYELGRENELTKEFYRLIGRSDYERAELMSSYLAYKYAVSNPGLLEYSEIKREIDRIEKAFPRSY